MKQPQKQTHITILHSDTQVDQLCYDQLTIHLSQLQREGLIKQWSDRQILAGSDRALAIDEAIRTADILLLLISADFLASDICYLDEMKQALQRHKRGETRIIPLIVRPCDWPHSPFGSLQYLPRNGEPISTWDNQDKAFFSVVEDLRVLITQQQFPPPPLPRMPRQNRERLLKRVRDIWITGLLDQSLHQATWLDLHLQDQPDALENPWRMEVQELNRLPRPLPIGTSIVQVYNKADGKLLILGEPGSGKTTLLLHLARTLLDYAETDERYPMPVVFNLSLWAEKRQPLGLWLREELWTKYQVPRKIGKAWIETDQVLPLLDGLDEVAREARSACVEQINNYYQSRLERGSSPIVVCCRSEEYAALSTHAMLQHAVSILPLTDEQINTYLEQAGEQVKALKQALNEDTKLHSLAHHPLMLNIFTLAYQGATVAEVPTGETREDAQHTVFARYVERMLKRRKKSKRWEPEQVIRWLTFLAKQMQQHNQTIFSVESLQPTWLSNKRKILYQWCTGLPWGLAIGLLFKFSSVQTLRFGSGLVLGPILEPFSRLVLGPVWGSVLALVVGLLALQIFGLDTRINPAETLTWSWKKARLMLVVVLMLGLVLWWLIGLRAVWLPAVILTTGSLGLLLGLSGKQLPKHLSFSPNAGIWRSGRNGLMIGLVIGLIYGLLSGLILGLTTAALSSSSIIDRNNVFVFNIFLIVFNVKYINIRYLVWYI